MLYYSYEIDMKELLRSIKKTVPLFYSIHSFSIKITSFFLSSRLHFCLTFNPFKLFFSLFSLPIHFISYINFTFFYFSSFSISYSTVSFSVSQFASVCMCNKQTHVEEWYSWLFHFFFIEYIIYRMIK